MAQGGGASTEAAKGPGGGPAQVAPGTRGPLCWVCSRGMHWTGDTEGRGKRHASKSLPGAGAGRGWQGGRRGGGELPERSKHVFSPLWGTEKPNQMSI